MQATERYVNERLDHLGIVAGVCQEIGLAAWLDAQDPDNRQQVSVGTATVAMILNGLGFSNRQLYLVPQFFANKPVEHLLGPGISAEMLNDDCLGRTLDWLYAHDPTKLFAGIASRARQVFGISARQVHVDTTSFSVSGQYTSAGECVKGASQPEEAEEAALIAITYGYSRDHRADWHRSGCWHWPPPTMATSRSSCNRWMAIAVIRSVWWQSSGPSRHNCVRRMGSQVCMWRITASTAKRICDG